MDAGVDDGELEPLGDRKDEFFRVVCGRRLNALNPRYLLPADDEELRRMDCHHRLMQFLFDSKHYVREVLATKRPHKRRILDLGTGSGLWAIEMADEFPDVEVTGVDLAPIQPLSDVPPNCNFEIFDLDRPALPYPSDAYDVIHARSIFTGIRDYPAFLRELTRMLRPGGLLLLVEFDPLPTADGRRTSAGAGATAAAATGGAAKRAFASGAPGWDALWDAYVRALRAQGADPAVPARLSALVWATRAYDMSRTFAQQADVPVGFSHKDPTLLTVGQLAWMDVDGLISSLRPYLHSLHLPEWNVDSLIEDAQADLYQPVVRLSSRLHVVRGIKR